MAGICEALLVEIEWMRKISKSNVSHLCLEYVLMIEDYTEKYTFDSETNALKGWLSTIKVVSVVIVQLMIVFIYIVHLYTHTCRFSFEWYMPSIDIFFTIAIESDRNE